jgi:hypothetical protein
MRISETRSMLAFLLVLVLAMVACDQSGPPPRTVATPSAQEPAAVHAPSADGAAGLRNLSADESMGGHTLARHVGKTDAELVERLRREPQITSASTYVDRATAERVVGTALAESAGKLDAWRARGGRRPNLALHYRDRSAEPIGRSLSRGQQTPAPCSRAVVVRRWDERRDRFYVLTSYPEAGR